MDSVEYMTGITNGLLLLISAGVSYRCIEICVTAILNGEGFGDAIKKIKKKISVAIICASLATLISIIKRYYV